MKPFGTRRRVGGMLRRVGVVSLIGACVWGVPLNAAGSTSPFAGDDRWIAYQTDRGGEGVWLIHPDGTDDHRIAADVSSQQLLPDWSPDGTRLAFTTRGDVPELLFEYDLASETARPLFECAAPCLGDDEPAYSPDGSSIAFIRALGPFVDGAPADCSLWIGDVETGDAHQVTHNTGCDREYQPQWSPDGQSLTYWRWREEPIGTTTGTAVFVVSSDGTNERQLTDWEMFAGSPDWSSDGDWIIFSTYPLQAFQEVGDSNLYRISPDGTGAEQLTGPSDHRATQPRYTPDGEWILFTSVTPSARTLSVLPADGGGAIAITTSGIYTHGVWQP